MNFMCITLLVENINIASPISTNNATHICEEVIRLSEEDHTQNHNSGGAISHEGYV